MENCSPLLLHNNANAWGYINWSSRDRADHRASNLRFIKSVAIIFSIFHGIFNLSLIMTRAKFSVYILQH